MESPAVGASTGQLEGNDNTPPEYGELSHEELAQIRSFEPNSADGEKRKQGEEPEELAQSYADRELPSDLRAESKNPSALTE